MRLFITSLLLSITVAGYGQVAKVSEQDYIDLFEAVESGNPSTVAEVVGRGVDVNRPLNGCYAINRQADALTTTMFEIYDILLKAGADINARDSNGYTLLYRCAAAADTARVRFLLERKAAPNQIGYLDETPLHGLADNNPFYDDPESPSILDSRRERIATMKLLIEYGADVNAPNAKGKTPLLTNMESLHYRNYHNATIRLLTSYGASSIVEDYEGLTPLKMLDRVNYDSLTQELMWRQAQDINRRVVMDMKSIFELYKGVIGIGVIRNLLVCGINTGLPEGITLCDSAATKLYTNSTPLIIASKLGLDHLVTGIISRGGDIDRCDELGNNALMMAVEGGYHKTVELLLTFGANVSHGNMDRLTPLRIACRNRDYDMLELLFRHSDDARTEDGNPIIDAVQMGDAQMVKFLIGKKANVDAYGEKGRTPILLAAQSGNAEIVKLLLDAGADCTITDDADQSVWDHAKGKDSIMTILPQQK